MKIMKQSILLVAAMAILASPALILGALAGEGILAAKSEARKFDSSGSRIAVVPDDFARIQDAINSLDPGDTVFVKAGIYYENIVLNKSISLIGENPADTIVDAEGRSDVIFLSAGNCVVSGFTIQNGGIILPANCGVNVSNVDNNKIWNNTITGNFIGINLGDKYRGSTSNIIRYNNVTRNRYGIFLAHSNRNEIYGNIVSNSGWNGIELDWCDENIIQGNTIYANRAYGFEIPRETPGRDNLIYHNNFMNNSLGVSASTYVNTWDDGYPSGGNYWGDCNGKDSYSGPFQNTTGHDGIRDVPYTMDVSNQDRFPLVGVFHDFATSLSYRLIVVSNSTIEGFHYLESNGTIRMRVSNTTVDQAVGFCRVCIPHSLLRPGNISVLIDNGATLAWYQDLALYDNGTHRWIYFAYPHSTHEIVIMPEFSSQVMLAIFMMATAITVLSCKGKRVFIWKTDT